MLAIYGLVPTIVLIGEDVVLDNVKQKLVIKGCATAVTIDRVVIDQGKEQGVLVPKGKQVGMQQTENINRRCPLQVVGG